MLLGSSTRDSRGPLRLSGAVVPAGERSNYGLSGAARNFNGEARVVGETGYASVPSGLRHPYVWSQASKAGALASRNEIVALSAALASGAMGINGQADILAGATAEAIGELIVSAAAVIAAGGSATGDVVAALEMAAELIGAGSVAAAIEALAWAVGEGAGASAVTATAFGIGSLSGEIDVGAQVGLSAPLIAEELLDLQMVETGLTVRETLRICLAALAGKISGAPGTTITIRSATDEKDRIVATVDSSGNRTAVAIDAA